jgi:hypothetical protein
MMYKWTSFNWSKDNFGLEITYFPYREVWQFVVKIWDIKKLHIKRFRTLPEVEMYVTKRFPYSVDIQEVLMPHMNLKPVLSFDENWSR